MNQLRINKDLVTYIKVYNTLEGILSYWNGSIKYIQMEANYFKFLWFIKTPILNYPEGIYRNCKRKWVVNDTPTTLLKNEYIFADKLFTKPKIEIFAQEKIKQCILTV